MVGIVFIAVFAMDGNDLGYQRVERCSRGILLPSIRTQSHFNVHTTSKQHCVHCVYVTFFWGLGPY